MRHLPSQGYMACPEMGQAHIMDITKKNGETIDADVRLHES